MSAWKQGAIATGVMSVLLALMATATLAQAGTRQTERGHLTKAATGEGFHFSHHDWELACDNTRTCRAAGYHPEADERKVSVLLTRAAGPDTRTQGEVKIGRYGDDPVVDALPEQFPLAIWIDGRPMGRVELKQLLGELSAEQVALLVKALTKKSRIELVYGEHRWLLSAFGADATLFKLDAFQGRVGTPGALTHKGTRSELTVRPVEQAPLVVAQPLPEPQQADEQFMALHTTTLIDALRTTTNADDCPLLFESSTERQPITAISMSSSQKLLSSLCWRAAYNEGMGYWVTEAVPPFNPQLITPNATDGGGMTLASRHKGRGLGDCWAWDDWVWNGQAFVHVRSGSTGMCRLMEPGGTWDFPVLVTRVVRQGDAVQAPVLQQRTGLRQ